MERPIAVITLIGIVVLGGTTQPLRASETAETQGKVGRTSIQLVVVRDPVSFIQAWDSPDRRGTPGVPVISSLRRGSEFGLGIVFSGCEAGKDGKCALFATYSILTTKGEELVAMPDVPIWRAVPPQNGQAELGKGLWRTSSEASDPLGDYLYRAVVVDKVSGQSATLEVRLRLVD